MYPPVLPVAPAAGQPAEMSELFLWAILLYLSPMSEILFYHLERARLETVLPDLLEKTLAKGWRAVVRAPDRDNVMRLDDMLWTYRDETFLPHGAEAEDDPKAARQPVWITETAAAINQADVLFLVDGAEAAIADIAGFV